MTGWEVQVCYVSGNSEGGWDFGLIVRGIYSGGGEEEAEGFFHSEVRVNGFIHRRGATAVLVIIVIP